VLATTQRFHRDSRSDLTGLMTAHAVRNDEQTPIGKESVLIHGPNLALVSGAAPRQPEPLR